MRQPGDRVPAPGALALVQDLANTADIEAGADTLRDGSALAAFCAAHGLPDSVDVAAARELRELIREVCQAHVGVRVGAESLDRLRGLLSRGALRLDVSADGDVAVVPGGGDPLIAAVAAAIAAAAADGTWARLKACSARQCRWVYYDHSPAGRSRWCTMSICGSRAKMRAYRSKRR
jgi:predicted RNA-binding Zn ribbon-like protein